MLAKMKPKERSMHTPNHPHPFPQPRRSRLLLTALLLGGMSLLAACNMTANQLAAMKHRHPGVSEAELQAKWDDMTYPEQNETVELYESNVRAELRRAMRGHIPGGAAEAESRDGGGGGGDGGGGH